MIMSFNFDLDGNFFRTECVNPVSGLRIEARALVACNNCGIIVVRGQD